MFTPMKPPILVDHFILIYKPSHPRAFVSGYVPEQILVAESLLERPLKPDEEVKHINGNTRDNTPENIKIVSATSYKVLTLTESQAAGQKPAKNFVSCKYQKPCWAKIRAPIAKKNKIFLPYVCSFQTEGDIYNCGNFWTFKEEEISQVEGENDLDDSLQARGSSGNNL